VALLLFLSSRLGCRDLYVFSDCLKLVRTSAMEGILVFNSVLEVLENVTWLNLTGTSSIHCGDGNVTAE